MSIQQVIPNVYSISIGSVNVFLLEDEDDGLILIDTGNPGSEDLILQSIRKIGKHLTDIKHILVTHSHADHTGSLAALKKSTNAQTYMHSIDAELVKAGKTLRSLAPSPGLMARILFWLFIRPSPTIEPIEIENEVSDGDIIQLAGGIKAIHVPGHCAGQLAFLWPKQKGVLFAADTCINKMGLGLSIGYEDIEEGKRSLHKLANLEFETALFSHGNAIIIGASKRFKEKWG